MLLAQLLRRGADTPERPLGRHHNLHELFMSRYRQLTESSRRFLTLAAGIGRIFNPQRIPIDVSLTSDALDELRGAQLIEVEGSLWQFTHALIRDSIYESLSEEERVEVHLKLADAHRDHLSLRAEHLALARDPLALSAYLQAGEERESDYKPHSAIALYERALSLTLTASDRLELLCRQGWLFEQLGDGRSCLRYFDEAYTTYEELERGDVQRRSEVLLGRLAAQRLLGDLTQAEQSVRELNSLISSQGYVFPLFKARLAYYQGSIAFSRGELESCHRSHREAISQIEGLHHIGHQRVMLTYAQAWSGCGDALYAQGNFKRAEEAMRRAVELAREHRFGRVEVSTLHMLAIVTTYLGDAQRGLQLAHQCHQLAMNVNDARATLFAELNMALPMLWAGQASEALIYCQHAAQRVERMNSQILLGMSRAFLAYTLWWAGERDQAQAYSEAALHISSKQGSRLFGGVALGAALLCLDVSADQRRAWVDQGMALLATDVISHNYLYFTLGASLACFRDRDRERLAHLSSELKRFFDHQSDAPPEPLSPSLDTRAWACPRLLITWVDKLYALVEDADHLERETLRESLNSGLSRGDLLIFEQMARALTPEVSP